MTGVRSEFERARNVVEPFFLLTICVMSNVLARWAPLTASGNTWMNLPKLRL